MTLGEAKAKAIKLINEYSTNGKLTAEANNEDYTLRMNDLADDAQKEIAEKISIDATTTFTITEDLTAEGYNSTALPVNFKEMRFVRLDDERFYDFRIENGNILTRKTIGGDFELSYSKHPTDLDGDTSDSYEFEVDANGLPLIPYYMGGMVIADENDAISNKLLNIYYSRLNTLTKNNSYKPAFVANTMGW